MDGKRQIRLTQEGALYGLVLAAVLVGATARQLNLLMLVGAMLAGPFLFSLIIGRIALARLIVKRSVPPQLRTDQRLAVDVQVTNHRHWLRCWSVRVEDQVARQVNSGVPQPPTRVRVYFATIAGGDTARATYHGQLGVRGRYEFGPLRVSTRFPLGLIRHVTVLPAADTLVVHPRLGQLTRELAQVVRESAAGAQRLRRGTLEADFYGLRDWRTGDSRRWIHWRTSARRGGLVVRQFEQRRSQDLAVLVDLWCPRDASSQQLHAVEQAVSFAATLVAEACSQPGRQMVLHVAGAAPLDRAGAASAVFFREQMDALSVVEPHHQDELADSVAQSLAAIGPGVPTIVITTRPLDLETLETVAARHDVAVAGRRIRVVNVASHELARFFRGR